MARSVKTILSRTEKALAAELSEFRSGLEIAEVSQRVFGFVVSSDFEGMDHHERQGRLRSILQAALAGEELERVGPIVTMTPAEADIGPVADSSAAQSTKPKRRAG